MKSSLLIPGLFSILFLFGAGCARSTITPPTAATSAFKVDEPSIVTSTVKIPTDKPIEPFHAARLVPHSEFTLDDNPPFYFKDYDRKDCIGLENGLLAQPGDLLSTLAADYKARNKLPLMAFSAAYSRDLQARIRDEMARREKSDFFTFYICHLSPEADILAGALVPLDKMTDATSTKKLLGDSKRWVMLLVQPHEVRVIKNVTLLDANATGGEIYPCTATAQKDGFDWRCFTGLRHRGNSAVGTNYKIWTMPWAAEGKMKVRTEGKER